MPHTYLYENLMRPGHWAAIHKFSAATLPRRAVRVFGKAHIATYYAPRFSDPWFVPKPDEWRRNVVHHLLPWLKDEVVNDLPLAELAEGFIRGQEPLDPLVDLAVESGLWFAEPLAHIYAGVNTSIDVPFDWTYGLDDHWTSRTTHRDCRLVQVNKKVVWVNAEDWRETRLRRFTLWTLCESTWQDAYQRAKVRRLAGKQSI